MKKIKITDTTIKDLFQSIEPKYMDLKILDDAAKNISSIKFDTLEIFGGSAFEEILGSYLYRSPFEIAYYIKEKNPSTTLQALIGAKNLVGMEIYSNNIIKKFIKQCKQYGIDSLKIYDALNDIKNFEFIINTAIENGIKCQGTIIYDDLNELNFYVNLSAELSKLGCESICIKDVESTLVPQQTGNLFKALTESINLPFFLSVYNIRGLQVSNYYSACSAGCSGIDLSFVPSGYNNLNLSIFSFLLSLKDTGISYSLDYIKALEMYEWIKNNIYKFLKNDFFNANTIYSNKNFNLLPRRLLLTISHQLHEIGDSNKLDAVLEEIFKIKSEIGNPSLAAPVGQIIGSQAILNAIISDYRWEMTSDEIKKLIKGYYGRLPRIVRSDLLNKISLKAENENDISNSFEIEDTFDQCSKELKKLSQKEEDILCYCFFPEKAMKMLKHKNQGEQNVLTDIKIGDGISPKTKLKLDDIDIKKIKEIADLIESSNIDEIKLEIEGVKISINKKSEIVIKESEKQEALKAKKTGIEKQKMENDIIEIKSPIVGTFYRSPSPDAPPFVNAGDHIKKGMTLCIIEAMKLMNKINSDYDGVITEILIENEEAVEYNQTIMLIKIDRV